jgi:CRISPR-associated protein Cas2
MSATEYEVLVCYDVEDDKARRNLYDALKDIGLTPIQKSVFWGHIRPAEERAVLREFRRLLEKDTDRAFLVRSGLSAVHQRTAFGYRAGELDRPADHVSL